MEHETRTKFEPSRKALTMLLYQRLNGEHVTSAEFVDMIRAEGFKDKPAWVARKFRSMLERGFIESYNDEIYLTQKGVWYVEGRQHILQAMLYGFVLGANVRTMSEVSSEYARIMDLLMARGRTYTNNTRLLMKRLKRGGGVDYTKDKVWYTKKIKTI